MHCVLSDLVEAQNAIKLIGSSLKQVPGKLISQHRSFEKLIIAQLFLGNCYETI